MMGSTVITITLLHSVFTYLITMSQFCNAIYRHELQEILAIASLIAK